MKETSFNSSNQIAEIEKRFWQLFDFFHSIGLRREEYFVALYLIYVYYKRIDLTIKVYADNSNIEVNLSELNSSSLSLDGDQKRNLSNAFKPILEKIGEYGIRNVVDILNSIDRNELKSDFPEIFDRLLYRLSKSQGRFAGEYIMPQELSRFMCGLAELPKNAKVYNPFAGLASFGVFLDEGHEYFGQEINPMTWAIGVLRILAYERKGISEFNRDDSINNWNPRRIYKSNKPVDILNHTSQNEKFDLIISEPPFGVKVPRHISSVFGGNVSYEHFLIENGLETLKPDGKLIICVSQGLLFRSGDEQNLRSHLIENDLLEMVISLPGGLLMNTGIPVAILVINKNKSEKGYVRFVEGKNFVESTSTREKKLNYHTLNSAIRNSKESDILKIVSNNTIIDYEYNLNVPLYFQKEFEGVMLRDLGTVLRGQRTSLGEKGKFVRIRDLKEDKSDFELALVDIEVTELPRHARLIEESCILIAIRWKTLKPTYFNYSGTPIFVTPDIVALKINESKVNFAFLANELHADYITEQLLAYRVGDTFPAIRRNDLLKIKIVLPSIEEQRAKVSGILELSARINQLQLERNALAHGYGEKQFNEFASLKHTLGAPRQNILSYAEALISFFENNPSVESEKVSFAFKEKTGVDLSTAFHAIKHDINFISELLEKGENGLLLSDYKLVLVNLVDLEKLIAKVKAETYSFTLRIQPLKSYEKTNQGIICNDTLFKILLDNILINAQKHGFDSKLPGNEVIIDLSIVDDNLIVDIKNNGKPFQKGFNKEKFISKYSTANPNNGTGIGGYDINRIIEYFNGTWDLILNEDAIYPVRFRIQFPINPIF